MLVYDFILFPAIFLIWHLPLYLYDWSPTQMNLPSIIQCGASPRRPLLEYLPSLGRGTTIHLRIGHPYISPADVRPSNGFGSLAHNKDATVVVPAVAAVGRPPIVRKLHYVLSHCVCMLFLFGWPPCQRSDVTLMEVSQHALDSLYIRSIWLLYIVMFFVNLIRYLYLFWLNKHCLSLSLSLSLYLCHLGVLPTHTRYILFLVWNIKFIITQNYCICLLWFSY